MFLPSKRLLSAFYKTPPSKNPSKNLSLYLKPLQAPSKNPSKKHLLLENLLRTLLRSVRLHDPLGVRPSQRGRGPSPKTRSNQKTLKAWPLYSGMINSYDIAVAAANVEQSECKNEFGKSLQSASVLSKRKHTPPCSSEELPFAEKKKRKKGGPQRKDFAGRYGFLGFFWVFVSTTGLESFSLRPEKFPKRMSFGGGRVRFFSSLSVSVSPKIITSRKVVSKRWFEFCGGRKFRYPPVTSILLSSLPHFNLFLTKISPHLTSAHPPISNHGLETFFFTYPWIFLAHFWG